MALTRIGVALSTTFSHAPRAGKLSPLEQQLANHPAVSRKPKNALHVSSVRRYPDAPQLPLPTNVSEIFANETGRFTPERARDIAAPVLLYGKNTANINTPAFGQKTIFEQSSAPQIRQDSHVDSYDCFGAVSLNGSMQTTVPKPFCSSGKAMHLNMPGGQWARDGKYIAEDMQKSHYRNSVKAVRDKNGITRKILSHTLCQPMLILNMDYSTNMSSNSKHAVSKAAELSLSKRDRFKKVIKEYGCTAIIFHVGISLISLGGFYTAVVSGLDLTPYIKLMVGELTEKHQAIVNNSSNFLIAYAIHKIFAPVRISITIVSTPVLARYLRRIGLFNWRKVKST